MPLSPDRFEAAKAWLFEHYDAQRPMPELREPFPEVSVDDAFRLQFALVDRRLAQGETVAGVKAALTAKVMQRFFGVHEPCPGLLPSGGLVESGRVSVGGWVMANVEPEIAFLLARPLEGPGATVTDVMSAAEGVMASLEIGHLRYGKEPRSIETFLAVNTLNGGFVLGNRLVDLKGLDLRLEGMLLEIDGQPAGSGAGAEALGDPRAVVAFLANALARYERRLEAGSIVMTGSLVQGPIVQPGQHVRARFTHLGDVEVFYTE
ncbi:MAG: fumarylacetoacetate hydrolase family protein [SAR324 cluster bacterium]|nr:fumarylacetoacetate hydrolase family protein [SAR324 cluster bacterium]